MQMVDVIVPTNAVCDKMLPNNLPWDKYTDSQICAGGADKDACQGKDFFLIFLVTSNLLRSFSNGHLISKANSKLFI